MPLKKELIILPFLMLAQVSTLVAQHNSSVPGIRMSKVLSGTAIASRPGLLYPDYPLLDLPNAYRNRQLPASVDNSVYPYLRPVFTQMGASCGQAASVGYNFCYEINRVRGYAANIPENQYPTHFTWNFLNYEDEWGVGVGVSYFRSFEILKNLGCPNEATYGSITFNDPYYWMSGYEKYRQAMQNRIKAVNSINLATHEGLLTLKNWLNDHLDGSITGGVANFYTGIGVYTHLPATSPEAGKCVITGWNPSATHALTIVGYNDSIRYDLNHDGLFTNHVDINTDGIIDIKDWEIGGIKFVNSYGVEWADSGFCYALYSSLAFEYGQGGIWNNSAHVITVEPDYQPLLTLKADISHTMRGRIRITAGVNADTNAAYASTVMEFPVFDFQGGDYYMCGGYNDADKEMELGLDITPLIGACRNGTPSRFFLIIEEDDPDNLAAGIINQFSIISNLNDTLEFFSTEIPCNIINNSTTMVSVVIPGTLTPIEIMPGQLSASVVGSPVNQQLSATTGEPPFEWYLLRKYSSLVAKEPFVPAQGEMLNYQNAANGLVTCHLPFSFPYYGKEYDSVFVHSFGYLLLDPVTGPYPYLQDASLYMMQTKAVAPFINLKHHIAGTGTGVWFESAPDKAVITWALECEGSTTGSTDNFSVILYPDGQIGFSFGSLAEEQVSSITAISNGDGVNFHFCDSYFARPSSRITLVPNSLPDGLTIDSQGLITSDPLTDDFSADISVTATDNRHIRTEKTYRLTTGPLIKTTFSSGTDGLMEPGETVRVSLFISNITGENCNNITLKLHSLSQGVLMEDSVAVMHGLNAGQEAEIPEAFRFIVSDSLNHEQELIFSLDVEWDGYSMQQNLIFPLVIKQFLLSGPLISDGNDNRLDAGESGTLLVRLTHGGVQPAETFKGILHTSDRYISISGSPLKVFSKSINNRYDQASWSVTANTVTPPGRIVNFSLTAFSDSGDTLREEMKAVIGKPTVLVIDLDGNKNSARHITSAMEQAQIMPDNKVAIENSIFGYDQLFLCLGTKPLNYELTEDDAGALEEFLKQGNNLYMEGGATFGNDDQYPIHERFRVDAEKKAWYHPADTLAGDTLTFTSGIEFDYRGDHTMAYGLIPLEPAFSVFSDVNSGYHFVVANDSVDYRTIASTVEFGGIFPYDGSSREEILLQYLDFLNYKTQPLAANFISAKDIGCSGSLIGFTPHCAGTPVTYHWIFEGGTPAESADEVAFAQWSSPGTYDVSLTVSDGRTSNTIVKENCIEILNCNGTPDSSGLSGMMLYPNPVSDLLVISIYSYTPDHADMVISDLSGRTITNKNIVLPEGLSNHEFDLTSLRPGLYILSLLNIHTRISEKIVVR